MRNRKYVGDVVWCLPNRQGKLSNRPFYRGTLYAKNSLTVIGKEYIKENNKSPTVKHLREMFWYQCEETQILDKIINAGFGDELYFRLFD